MVHVVTINLTPDLHSAQPDLGPCEVGEVDEAQLLALLETFRQLDAVQNSEAEPRIVIHSPAGKFSVRTGLGRLFLYDARDITQAGVELDAPAVIRQLHPRSTQAEEEPLLEPTGSPALHRVIAIAILTAGLLLNAYTLYSVFYIDDVNKNPPITLVTDPQELAALANSVAGRYSTGAEPGDRVITVGTDAHVAFSRVGPADKRLESGDTFRLGRHDGKVCLATPDSGVIDVLNIDTIVYYRDVYHRASN